jgi:hypothetical protein
MFNQITGNFDVNLVLNLTVRLVSFSIYFNRNILKCTIVENTNHFKSGETILIVFFTDSIDSIHKQFNTFEKLFPLELQKHFLTNGVVVDHYFGYSSRVNPFKIVRSKPIHIRGERLFIVNNEKKKFFKRFKLKTLPIYAPN